MNFSIRTRLSISFALLFVILIILFSGVFYYLMSSDLERGLAQDTAHDFKEVLLVLSSESWEDALAEMPEESREFKLNIKVSDPNGGVLYLTEGVKERDWPVDKDILTKALNEPVWSNEEINGVSHLILTQSFVAANKLPYFLQGANSRADINKIRNQIILWINVGTPIILTISILMGSFFAKKALAPVEKIRARAETIKSDDLQSRLVYDGPPDELHRLTNTLNDLLSRIQHTMNQMKRFIADASHQLRIPLSGIRGTLEVGLRQKRSPEESHEIMDIAYHESERLSELVIGLLSLARVDAGEMKLEKTEVEVDIFLKNVFEEAEALNAEKKVNIRLGNAPRGKAKFDEARVHQLLINLIENAILYNKPGGDITLSAGFNGEKLNISVKDSGIGIAPEDQSKIFDRFYRVDKARSRESGGTGLGLAIARSIAEAHQGKLTVQSVFGQGSEFTLSLPVNSDQPRIV